MVRLRDITDALGLPPLADAAAGDREVARVTSPEEAGPADLCYAGSEKYADKLATSRAGFVIAPVKLDLPESAAIVLRVPDPELAIARILELFAPPPARPDVGVHPTAVIADGVVLGVDVSIGPCVTVARGSTIGDRTVLHAGVAVGQHVKVGVDCELYSNVSLRERVVLGDRVIIHANAVVGSDGFGFRWDGKRHVKVPQIGIVVIEDDVEIGSCSCIDRAKFGETRIGKGTKLDNLVQVGHNVRIGMHAILCGQVAVGGSTTLGNGVVMGGGAAARDHIALADGAMAAAKSGIGHDVGRGETVAGTPAVPHRNWLREQAALRKLPDLVKEVRKLEALVAELKAAR